MKLPPPLTDPPCPDPDSRTTAALIAWAMAYGQQCHAEGYRHALEDAAREAERTYIKSATLFALGTACAAAIRALAQEHCHD